MAKKTKEQQPTLAMLMAEIEKLQQAVERLQQQNNRSIGGFCLRQGISLAHFYVLRANGLAPRTGYAGQKQIVTPQAESEWESNLPTQPATLKRSEETAAA